MKTNAKAAARAATRLADKAKAARAKAERARKTTSACWREYDSTIARYAPRDEASKAWNVYHDATTAEVKAKAEAKAADAKAKAAQAVADKIAA
jgi:hypothetical protein